MADDTFDIARLARERDMEKFRADAEQFKSQLASEVAAMKSEANGLNCEVERLKAQLAAQVSEAKTAIGDHALSRMSKALTEFRYIVLAAVAVLGSLGVLSWFQLDSQVSKTITARLDDWLALDKPGSPSKEALETARARAQLDVLKLQAERAELTAHDAPLQVSEADRDRLVTYLLKPGTPLSDFQDGVQVLAASLGRFNPNPDPGLDKLVEATFTQKPMTDERAWVLLETLTRYSTMARYAAAQLNDASASKLPEGVRSAILTCWEGADPDAARAYAREHLAAEKSLQLGEQEAELLAGQQGDQKMVDEWLKAHAKAGAEPYVDVALSIAPAVSASFDFGPDHRQQRLWARTRFAALLMDALRSGASLSVMDTLDEGRALGFDYGRGTRHLPNPGALFSRDDTLATELSAAAASANLPPERFVTGLSARSNRGELFGLQVDSAGLALTGETYGAIDASSVVGPVMLVNLGGPHPVQASFRTKDGRWIVDRVTAFAHFYGAGLHFAYDQSFIERADMRGYRRLTWNY